MENQMPRHLKLVFVWLAVAAAVSTFRDVVDGAVAKGALLGALDAATLLALWKGNDWMRELVRYFCWAGVALGTLGALLLPLVGGPWFEIAVCVVQAAASGFAAWTLNRPEVREWLFCRSLRVC